MQAKISDIISQDICKMFDFKEEDLYYLKVDFGSMYLKRRFQHDPALAQALQDHAKLWAWWIELWQQRDRQLLSRCMRLPLHIFYSAPVGREVKLANGDTYRYRECTTIQLCDVWSFYSDYHKPDDIRFYPNYVLINECLGVNAHSVKLAYPKNQFNTL